MNTQPTLAGNLVRLVPLSANDFSALYACASDSLIWEQHPEPLRYTRPVFERYFETIMNSKGALAVIDTASGRIIGASTYYDYNLTQREVSIGYTFIERSFWGKGHNPEVKSLMLTRAFRYVDRVLFEVGAGNVRSQIALRNIGAKFVRESTLPGLDGTPIRCNVFAIDKS